MFMKNGMTLRHDILHKGIAFPNKTCRPKKPDCKETVGRTCELNTEISQLGLYQATNFFFVLFRLLLKIISSYFHVIFPILKPPIPIFLPQGGPTVTVGKGLSPWFIGSEVQQLHHWTKESMRFSRSSLIDTFPRRWAQKGWTQIDPHRGINT